MISFQSIIELIDNVRFVRIFPYMSLMVYCASLFVCESVRKSQRIKNMTWIESLFMCFIGQFGGTTLASLLIGQPVRFLTSDKLVVAMLAAWITIFCLPYDIGLKLFQNPLIRLFCRFFQLLSISFSVTSYGVDYVFKSDHPKAKVGLSMVIATGTMSGCGGGVLLRYYNLINEDFTVPRRMSVTDDNIETHSQKLPQDLIRPTLLVF
ncbi:uncharacterized protein [Blastocystis hominis]|uniref:Uncharacterized protein n=1 Tax=Blastocystis hominis TaxID=12968 RepID=D8M706_BLAHO|nr:uncharacterized protein [Blastocystis hominis]CBK23845.2 unnamed protein product [Blastocystis hominis]|eukprot:XP_012897893.1 uncharacterized protein [Blastocystis hominis]